MPCFERQLQRIETSGLAVPELKVFTSESAHKNFQAAILVEDHLGSTVLLQKRDKETDEYGLAGAGGSTDEGVSGVFAAAAFGVSRVARVQGKVVRRAGRRA